MDAISAFADHVVRTGFHDLPGDAVKSAKTFILDTLGVGLAGSCDSMARELAEMQATWGAFGGTAALSKLMGLDQAAAVNAFSIAYGQCCGTMQAHTEGSALLAMQMGFNARNAIIACDLAARGFDGPKNVLEGLFGY